MRDVAFIKVLYFSNESSCACDRFFHDRDMTCFNSTSDIPTHGGDSFCPLSSRDREWIVLVRILKANYWSGLMTPSNMCMSRKQEVNLKFGLEWYSKTTSKCGKCGANCTTSTKTRCYKFVTKSNPVRRESDSGN